MSNIIQCPGCKGAKRIPSLGMITFHDCEWCKGIGYIEESPEEEVKDKSPEIKSTLPPSKKDK